MLNQKQFLALLGFAFVVAWISLTFGYALLCLVGAAVFYSAAAVLEGEVDLGELQRKVRGGSPADLMAPPAPPPHGGRPRVR